MSLEKSLLAEGHSAITSKREFTRPEAWAVVGGIAIPIVAYFVLPAIPLHSRTAAGLGFGGLFFILAVVFLTRRFGALEADIAKQGSEISKFLTRVTKDESSGILHMGTIRNVQLRKAKRS